MPSDRAFRCVRCGRDVYKPASACRDCRAGDKAAAERMAQAAKDDLARIERLRARAYRRPLAPVFSVSGVGGFAGDG